MTTQTFPHEIEYYRTEKGNAPFKEWLEALRDVNGRAKIRVGLDRARLGNFGDHKHLDEGVWELRIDYGPGYRVYFAKEENRLILLLIGGDKGSQKRDIAQPPATCRTTEGDISMTHVTDYQKDLIEALKDPAEAAAYLNAALEEGDRETFLLALRNVAEANGGMAAVADKAHLNRESLYRTLSRRGNPEIRTLFNLLHGVGLRLNITPETLHDCSG